MHRCLTITEIRNIICFNLDASCVDAEGRLLDPPHPDNRPALAALARTCTSFSGPALDVLWRTQISLVPLLRCMPEDLFPPYESQNHYARTWSLTRPIVTADWKRPQGYMPRVKRLSFSYDVKRLGKILPVFSLCLPGGFLFPNLDVLDFSHWLQEFAPINIFLAPKLSTIGLRWQVTDANLSVFSTLATACPGLTNVTLSLYPTSLRTDGVSSQFVRELRSVESLSMGTPDVTALEHIGRFPALTELRLASLPDGLRSPSRSPSPMFTRVRILVIGTVEAAIATNFLRMGLNTPLTSVRIGLGHRLVGEIEGFCDALRAHCLHSSLTSLTITNDPFTEAPDDALVTGSLFHTLSCFINLRDLAITTSIGFDLDDTALAGLAREWHNLRTLELRVSFRPVSSRITLISFHTLAQNCPQLETLSLVFDATSIPVPPVGTPRVSQQSLTTLNVASSPISASSPVARFLSGIFPSLDYITTDREDEDNSSPEELEENGPEIRLHVLWKEVEMQVPQFVLARQEEKMWSQT
ncbi:hypothetical protein B0H11DRAFT_670908 [Mycena galericulata]|nr:hypothetical protein B0H11DRAFT_670908 [Mycena galericulata]